MNDHQEKEWRTFEKFVAEVFREIDPTCEVNYDELLLKRQIDVTIRKSIVGTDFLIIVQVKYYKKSVPIADIDAFESVIREVQANKGIIVSNMGFTAGALEKARKTKIELYSVLDSSKPKFKRPSIQIPIVKSTVKIFLTIKYTFNVNSAGKSIDIPAPHFEILAQEFMQKWINKSISTADGIHQAAIKNLPTSNHDLQFESGSFNYEVKRRYHFKKLTPTEYKGFQSFVTENFTPSFVKFENIPLFEDLGWEYVSDISIIPIKVSHLETEIVSSNMLNLKFLHFKWNKI